MTMSLFCHFDILVFEFHAILTIWNTKYIKISCLLSADGAGALFYFLFLANFVDGASAYFFFYFYFNFLFKRASESEDQGINLVWPKGFTYSVLYSEFHRLCFFCHSHRFPYAMSG